MSATQPLVAPVVLSIGDPAGIGPELIAEAWHRRTSAGLPPFIVTGGVEVLRAASTARGLDVRITPVSAPNEALEAFADGLPVLAGLDAEYRPGHPDQSGAALALGSLEHATEIAIAGAASALVTAPIAKSELGKIGFDYPGQTEFLADACDMAARDAVMMLAGPSLRTVPLTVHCALSGVPGLISHDLICHKARIVSASLARDFGIERPRLAIAALNPHAGEDGKFGNEEARIIAPAIAALREEGIDATGPHPADALFAPHARSRFDAALCMYHDQALIPLKALEFDQGVNVTLGLPIVRTSPDHGTAFDIAGKGIADPGALIAAIRMAGECAARRTAQGAHG
ncbi:4-hydroxythreonine-4-phosphate dehydrogenase PdxA [Altererythrobacter sp.]|uniref:4-hydroxythreonine-4-phosphate dehydrogenase PdxA n=1 Tax=Altererythrobacter sp. TaxID=1872480 RepID=UPI003D0C6B3D